MSGGEPRPASWWAGLVPVDTADLSAEGHARLLQMTYERIRFSISAIPAVALPFVFYYRRFDEGPWLALWGCSTSRSRRLSGRWIAATSTTAPCCRRTSGWRAGVAGIGLLDGVHREGTDGVGHLGSQHGRALQCWG